MSLDLDSKKRAEVSIPKELLTPPTGFKPVSAAGLNDPPKLVPAVGYDPTLSAL